MAKNKKSASTRTPQGPTVAVYIRGVVADGEDQQISDLARYAGYVTTAFIVYQENRDCIDREARPSALSRLLEDAKLGVIKLLYVRNLLRLSPDEQYVKVVLDELLACDIDIMTLDKGNLTAYPAALGYVQRDGIDDPCRLPSR